MKITILNGSPRKGGNTKTMVNEFIRGAEEALDLILIKQYYFWIRNLTMFTKPLLLNIK